METTGVATRGLSTAADGSGDSEEIIAAAPGRSNTLSPEGKWLIGEGDGAATSPDIVYAQLDAGDVQLKTYLRADWHEEDGEVSSDGRWLAYQTNEGGTHANYIRSFPEPGPVVRLSDANQGPLWTPTGDAVFYVRNDVMVRRDVRRGEAVELGEETELFQVPDMRGSTQYRNYDIHPDGDRFLFVSNGNFDEEPVTAFHGIGPVVIVANWFEELKQRMGEGR